MKRFLMIAGMVAAFGLGSAGAYAATNDKPPAPPGQGECAHGNSQQTCKDDPQPTQGKDCENHGNSGGVNEDHCTSTTTETTPSETTPEDTTPQGTTPQGTTPETTTPETTTPQTPISTAVPSTPTATSEPAAAEAPAAPEAQEAPKSPQKAVSTHKQATQTEAEVAGATASAPTTAPQAPPFTP